MNKVSILTGILVCALLVPGLLFAQQGKIRGVVTDEQTGDPLPAANVVIEGTTMGASADLNGVFVILGVPPGVYTVRANFIGYQAVAIENIRVSADITTTQDYALPPSAIEVDELVIVAERPLVQRNTTNTIRMTTQEDIQNLPIRGLQNIVALSAGTVQQDGALHVRGGRAREIAYYVDGATATNPLFDSENISVIQEAIEELQLQSGGYTAETGGGNSAVIRTTMRTGGPQFTATLDYRTDAFADPEKGKQFLNTTSRGYHNLVATFGGPLTSKLRYFVASEYNYQKNRSSIFVEPINFNVENNPWLVDDGLEGRTAGDTLPGPLVFQRNFLPDNDWRNWITQGTLVYNFSNALKFRLTGSHRYNRYPTGSSNFYDALNSYFDNHRRRVRRDYSLVSLRATHLVNPTTYYDVVVNWSLRDYKSFDPVFGDDWQKYSDARAWGAAGLDTTEWQSVWIGPLNHSAIFNFNLGPQNDPLNSYTKNSQSNIGGSLDFTTQLNKNIELKAGGRLERWTMRQWAIGNIRNYMSYAFGSDASTVRQWEDQKDENGNVIYTADYVRRVELSKRGNVRHYGWDFEGKKKINSGPLGPRHPIEGSAYVQTKLEYRDLILNIGLRYELFDPKILRPVDIEDPARDTKNNWVKEDELIETDSYTYLLPRLNFAFPVTDKTVFYAQYGRYVQMPRLDDLYRGGVKDLSDDVLPETRSLYGYFGQYVGFTAQPERTNQYELGIRQSLTDDFAFTVTAFYKDLQDLLRWDRVIADGTGDLEAGTAFMVGWINNDWATAKGLEMTLELRRTKRLAARLNYTLSNTRGTGSDSRSTRVAVSDATISDYPKLTYNLDYNQTHRGTIMLDYRFARGDGGPILQGIGLNALLTFNSGHSYTQVNEPHNLGQANPWNVGVRATQDPRGRNPVEPLNTSTTPWNFNVDVNLEKLFYFDRFNIKLYSTILNVFNTRNVINVYESTGTDDDDGWLKSSLAAQYIALDGYEEFYRAINLENRWAYRRAAGVDLWGAPRQIRFGLMVEFK